MLLAIVHGESLIQEIYTNYGQTMAFDNQIRNSILCEHTKKVAQHDHSRQNDTLKNYRRAVRSKNSLTNFSRCRQVNLDGRLKLRLMAESMPLAGRHFAE
jgi:hypothetical protein